MRALSLVAPLILVLSLGCGSESKVPGSIQATVPVKGKITHRGKPVTKGRITLEPTDGGREATGEIQPNGSFVLTTFSEEDGALIGVHVVTVSGADRPLPTKREPHLRISAGKTEYAIDLR